MSYLTPYPESVQVKTSPEPDTLCVRLQAPSNKDGEPGRCMWLSITPSLLPMFQNAGWSVLEVIQ